MSLSQSVFRCKKWDLSQNCQQIHGVTWHLTSFHSQIVLLSSWKKYCLTFSKWSCCVWIGFLSPLQGMQCAVHSAKKTIQKWLMVTKSYELLQSSRIIFVPENIYFWHLFILSSYSFWAPSRHNDLPNESTNYEIIITTIYWKF